MKLSSFLQQFLQYSFTLQETNRQDSRNKKTVPAF